MRLHRLVPCLLAAAAALLCTSGLAAELTSGTELMEALAARAQSVEARIAARDAPGGVADAQALAAAFEELALAYGRRDDGADAVRWSSQGKEAATELARLLAARELDRALQAAASLRATCAGCHRAYR